jgi:hypothetical protein
LKQIVSSGGREGYATAMAALWGDLATTLRRLEAVAAEPLETLAEDGAPDALSGLQYALHSAGEAAAGLRPPAGAEAAHAELAAALGDARDSTAEIAFMVELGGAEAAEPYVYEWRGALFRVRLARLRLVRPAVAEADAETAARSPWNALAAVFLVLGGSLLLAGAAAVGAWTLAAAGLVAFAVGALTYRP